MNRIVIMTMFAGIMAMLLALFIWAYFAFIWLKEGAWPAYTAIDGYCWIVGCQEYSWAYWPQDWLGLHKALVWLSPPSALFTTGLLTTWVSIGIIDGAQL